MPRFTKSADTSAMASCPTLPVKTGGAASRVGTTLAFGSIVGVKEPSLPEFWRGEGLAGTSIPESAAGPILFEVRDTTFPTELELFIKLEGVEETGKSLLESVKAG